MEGCRPPSLTRPSWKKDITIACLFAYLPDRVLRCGVVMQVGTRTSDKLSPWTLPTSNPKKASATPKVALCVRALLSICLARRKARVPCQLGL